ncbi:hypothetical protein OE903_18660 [Bacillus sp. B6(2022)]|nr:hypothetical protein [Bacillus sp. B6(2022)]
MAFHLAGVALSELFLKKRVEFLVTPKGIQTDKRHFHLKTMIPHLIFLLLSLLALVKIGYDVKVNGTMNADLMLINIFGCFITVQAYSWHCLWRLIDRVIGNQSDLSLKKRGIFVLIIKISLLLVFY